MTACTIRHHASTLIGRDLEIAALRKVLVEVSSGAGTVAMLVGEAGIGKTRLAEELAAIRAGGLHRSMGPFARGRGSAAVLAFRPSAPRAARPERGEGPSHVDGSRHHPLSPSRSGIGAVPPF
ncbi:MAG: hypothetical protein E2P02_20710 [Acidobacteria bacterium]|nr:MAG: hypothetical protein E2P02_20710 [Acidobacteriota bacterium]